MWTGIRIRVIQNLTSHRIRVPCSPPLPADAVRVVLPILSAVDARTAAPARSPSATKTWQQSEPKHFRIFVFGLSWMSSNATFLLQTKGRRSASWIVQFTGKIQKAAWYVDQHVGGTYWHAGSATFASTVKAWQLSQCLGWTNRSWKIDGNRNTSP